MQPQKLLLLVCCGLVEVGCQHKPQLQETYLHWGAKVLFWFLIGLLLGVYFEARLGLKEKIRPFIHIALHGLLIIVIVQTLFTLSRVLGEEA